MPSPAAVLFDNDGLVLDTETLWTLAEETLFTHYGLEFTIEHKRQLLGTAGTVTGLILERILNQPGRGEELRGELFAAVMSETLHGAQPMPGAVGLLARVRAAGLPLGLASNSPREFLDAVIGGAGLRDAFDVTLSVDDVEHPKPAPDLYLALAGRLGTSAERCVALEDSPTGVAAAHASGAFVIGVPSLDGVTLDDADMVCASLDDPRIAAQLGISAA
jgi:HAD superfamily hydrolase (TIGR01509 family)